SSLSRLRRVYSIFDDHALARLLGPSAGRSGATLESIAQWQRDVEDEDGLTQMLYVDSRFSLPDYLLVYTDKMSMAVSLEARVPYLDLELMRLAESIPATLKVKGRTGKWILRKALERWVPREVMNRRKIAFETPISEWLRGGQLQDVES